MTPGYQALRHGAAWIDLSARGRIVADGPCVEILADAALLAEHDLELPAGFDLSRIRLRTPADPLSDPPARVVR